MVIIHICLICYILIRTISAQCSGTPEAKSVGYTVVTVTPPGYPTPGYVPNLSCKWVVTTSITGTQILFRVTDMSLNCAGDTLNVYDGTDNTGSQKHSNECAPSGNKNLAYTVASTGSVYTAFTSDSTQNPSEFGFKMYTISAKDFSGTACTATSTLTATTTEQYITSPSFPNFYPINKLCTWEITTTDSTAHIYIEVKFINVEINTATTCYDTLTIKEAGTTIATLCEENKDKSWNPGKTYTSTGNNFTLIFQSDGYSTTKVGFLLSYVQTGGAISTNISSSESSSDSGKIAGGILGGCGAIGVGVMVTFGIAKKIGGVTIGAANQKTDIGVKDEESGYSSSSKDVRSTGSSQTNVKNKVSPTYLSPIIYPDCKGITPYRHVFSLKM